MQEAQEVVNIRVRSQKFRTLRRCGELAAATELDGNKMHSFTGGRFGRPYSSP